MSSKQLLRIALALGVLLLLWGAVALARRGERGPEGGFSLPRIDSGAVDTIAMTEKGDTTVLVRGRGGEWRVNGNAASSDAVRELLAALADSAIPSELVAQSASSHAALGVDTAGQRVRIVSGGKTVIDLTAGNRSRDFEGMYLRKTDETAVFEVRGGLPPTIERKQDDWREKRIASVNRDSVTTIEVVRGKRSYALRKQDSTWSFGSGAAADSGAVARLLNDYGNLQASGFATPAQADSANFAKPDRRIRFLAASGTPLVSLAFDSTASGYWVRHDAGGTVYRIDQWRMDQLTPADSALRRKK